MSVLAVIPARAGSKGVPGKNIRQCAGKPLLAWSIEAALSARLVDRVVVSSDSEEILRVGERYGAEALLRPSELATDTALTDPVLIHAVATVPPPKPYWVVLLQPTVPVRDRGLVDAAIRQLVVHASDSILTAHRLHFVWWKEAGTFNPGFAPKRWRCQMENAARVRRQDFQWHQERWAEDGSVYVTLTQKLLETGQRLCGQVDLLETKRTIDIDTEEDFLAAEAMLAARAAERTVA